MEDKFSKYSRKLASWTERTLAVFIFFSICIFFYYSTHALMAMDWSESRTFYEMIDRVLLLVIGIELMRTLITHDLYMILELLAIVIARKLLKPDLANLDIALSVSAFAGLLAAKKFLLGPQSNRE